MPVATTTPTGASMPPGIMVGSVYMPKQKQPTFAPKPDYKPTHTLTPAGLPSSIADRPYKAKYDPTVRLQDQAAKERMEAILENYVSDNDQAAELLRQTAASLKAARELEEMQRLSAMGMSHAQINSLMEKRLEEISHRHGKIHDPHTGIMEQLGLLSSTRRPQKEVKQPLSTREGLMTPQPNFTQKEMNTFKHGLLAFAKAKSQSQLDAMQTKLDEDTTVAHAVGGGYFPNVDSAQAYRHMHKLSTVYHYPWVPEATHAPVTVTPPPQAGTGAPPPPPIARGFHRNPNARPFPGGTTHVPTVDEYRLLPSANQRAELYGLRKRLQNAGVDFPSNGTFATLRRRYANILDNASNDRFYEYVGHHGR